MFVRNFQLLRMFEHIDLTIINLHPESSHVGKAHTIKGLRKHARRSPGIVHYRYTHFFLRLREGKPPKHYYPPPPTGHQKMEDTLNQLRERRIVYGLWRFLCKDYGRLKALSVRNDLKWIKFFRTYLSNFCFAVPSLLRSLYLVTGNAQQMVKWFWFNPHICENWNFLRKSRISVIYLP